MGHPKPYVLVVDDLNDAADSMAVLLTLWGYHAEPRYSGESALAAAAARRPQAVLLDIGMPRMDGFEFIARFRRLAGCGGTAVMLVSGHTGEANRARARQLGITHYLYKPADPRELRTLLADVVRPCGVTRRLGVVRPRQAHV